MKSKIITLILILPMLAFAQQAIAPKSAPIALTDAEQKRIGAAFTAMDAAGKVYRRTVDETATASLECDKAIAAVASIQKARLALEAAQGEWNSTLELVKARHSCEDCDLTPDGKALVKK